MCNARQASSNLARCEAKLRMKPDHVPSSCTRRRRVGSKRGSACNNPSRTARTHAIDVRRPVPYSVFVARRADVTHAPPAASRIDFNALAAKIARWGRDLGFGAIGIADTDLAADEAHLLRWLEDGRHGEMTYMARHGVRRSRPAELVPGTVRVITARLDYWPADARDARAVLADPARAYVSRYALGRDYHKVLRARLQSLVDRIRADVGTFNYRVFTDSAPVLEVALGAKSGNGWRGKHTLLLTREGSYHFLGVVLARSDRVQAGCFGAALMLEPARVAECVRAMRAAVGVPVTVKTRLGVDHHDSYEFVRDFLDEVAAAGCSTFVVHARKAWLSGLSPKENREIPPLDYGRVYRLKRDFPALTVVINGGFATLPDSVAQLEHVDGVMLGRAAVQDSWLLARIDEHLFGVPAPAESAVLEAFEHYVARELERGTPLRAMTRHLLGMRSGRAGGRRWRRGLGELEEGSRGLDDLRALMRTVTSAATAA